MTNTIFAKFKNLCEYNGASLVAQMIKNSACNAGDLGAIPESERSPGGRHGNPL